MKKPLGLLLLACLLFAYRLPAQCPPGQVPVQVTIVPDNYPNETSWELTNLSSGQVYATGSNAQGGFVCVPNNVCLSFVIRDSYGDGICCAFGNGSYTVTYNGTQVASGGQFTTVESTEFGNCAAGVSCSHADTITTGTWTAPAADHWYSFTPDSNGTYNITTCGLSTCDTKIWVYDHCANLTFGAGPQGTLYYNDNDCGLQSTVVASLQGGVEYWIRIGGTGCTGSIGWSINYNGPITGCTDPTACNYNPLATVSDTCIYAPSPLCPQAPDLMVVGSTFASSIYLAQVTASPCMVNEHCLTGYGTRDVIRFTTHIKNIGDQDYYIGAPGPNPGQFTYDNCHGHYHYQGYAEYTLINGAGTSIPVGFKNGFCVLDLECSGGGTAQYGCGDMGISHGCGDIYDASLDCQWVDITNVPDGQYTLIMRVNWDQSPDALGHYENDYTNNWAQVCVNISRTGGLQVTQIPNCAPYVDCLGVPGGTAVLDCNGNCNGNALMGDLDNNTFQQVTDGEMYVDNILNATIPVSNCNDLNQDGDITVFDAALITNCGLFNSGHTHQGGSVHDHCIFPSGVTNPADNVTLAISNVDFQQKYVDISILNSTREVVAYEFNMTGINITQVDNLIATAQYPIQPQFNAAGKVIGISYQDSTIDRGTAAKPLCRIWYSTTTASQICIDEIVDIVNENYEATLTTIGNPACVSVATSAQDAVPALTVTTAPMPFSDFTQLSFNNFNHDSYTVKITDITGRVLRTYENVRGNTLRIDRDDLAAGVYLFRLEGPQTASGKLIVQ